MNDTPSRPAKIPIIPILATIEDLSAIRNVHARSMRAAVSDWAGDDDIAAYTAHVYTPAYSHNLEEAIRSGALFTGWVADVMVGTCGWSPVASDPDAARIRWCHVHPMFARMGIGLSLLLASETAAADQGASILVATSTPHATGFFECAGYGVTAYGTRTLPGGSAVPVTFMRKRLTASTMTSSI